MPKIRYQSQKFKPVSLELIERANEIIEARAAQGYDLTLRQLYYQFVAHNWFPESWQDPRTGSTNNEKSYDKLGSLISNARRAGLIDWNAIVDRTRNIQRPMTWDGPADLVAVCARQFDVDRWDNQRYRPEVWVEKDALVGVLEVACRPWRCPYFSCRGYTSDSEIWGAAQRLARSANADQVPIIFHLGDHDPSGIDMTRDIETRLNLFAQVVEHIEVRRLALNMDQIRQYNPPPNPAKQTDVRYRQYAEQFGDESWELDALDPPVITALIADAMDEIVDPDAWQIKSDECSRGRRLLAEVSRRWTTLTRKLEKSDG